MPAQTWSFNVIAPPAVTLVSPTPGNATSVNATLIYKPYDPFGLQNCSLIFNGILNASTSSVANNTNNNFTLLNLSGGTYNWTVLCFDTDGESYAPPTQLFSVAAYAPNVTLISPNDTIVVQSGNVTFTWNATDNYSQSLNCTVWVDGLNQTTVSAANATATSGNATGLTDGNHTWDVSCINQGGITGWSSMRSLIVNQTPIVSLLSPAAGASTNNASVTFQFRPSDNDGFSNCSALH